MPELINKEDNSINLGELSRQNGLSEFENFKTLMGILIVKADFEDTNLKVQIRFKKEVD